MKKSTLVIDFDKQENSKRKIFNPPKQIMPPIKAIQTEPKKSYFTKRCFLLTLGISIFVIIAIIVTIILVIKYKQEDNQIKEPDPDIPSTIVGPSDIEKEKMIETEFEFRTEVGDLYSINVEQKYIEEITTNGLKNFQYVDRKTNYKIYIISETNSTEETKYFYNKTFLAAILISSQCTDTKNDNCEPEPYIELTEIKKGNLRFLDEIPDLKDIPLPLCLFNITNNDVITSIKCPETLQKNIRRNMILDLYFFRPPAIKRPEKEANNVTLTKSEVGSNELIRETNGGICNIPNTFESFCTTEMNTTVDPKGNVISYDEEAFTNVTRNINNSYIKTKITNLKDESEKIANVDKATFKEALDVLIQKLNPYFKYYEQFSTENFTELYSVSKNISMDNSRRNLREELTESLYTEQNLFNYTHYTDTKLFIKLRNEPGYNSESMKAMVNLYINDEEKEIIGLKEIINFDFIKKLFRILSKAGNEKALDLYNKIKLDFEHINDAVSNNITSLINLIMDENTKSLSAIFDSISNMETLKIFPMTLVDDSTNLTQKLNGLLNMINAGGMKPKIKILNEEINTFIINAHKLVDNIFQNIRALSRSLKSSRSILTEISTYYLNNTPNSFYDIIKESQSLLSNYYIDEENLIFSEVDLLINNFTTSLNDSIKSEQIKIDNLLEKLEKENITIENGGEEDKNLLFNNLKESKDIIASIISKVTELIKKEMNLKENGHFISDYDISSTNKSYYADLEETLELSKASDNDEIIDKIFDKTYSDFRDNYTKLMIDHRKKMEEQMTFLDNILDNNLFSEKNRIYIETNLSSSGLKITNSIRDENDDYLKLANKEIHDFLQKNNETLNKLMINFTTIFSEDALKNFEDLYEEAFQSSLNLLNKNIANNKKLTNDYFKKLVGLYTDNKKIIELLQYFQNDPDIMTINHLLDLKIALKRNQRLKFI